MYQQDTLWQEVQHFLPPQNRLNPSNLPQECFVQLGEENRIHLDVYTPAEEAKATVVLLHGVGGNGRLLSFLAVPLAAMGYEVVCPDLPLYGHSRCTGTVTYDRWVEVAVRLTRRCIQKGKPVFVFGLSAGGLLAYQTACAVPEVRGVLATCVLDQRQREITRKTAASPILATLGLPLMACGAKLFPNMKIPMKWVANMKAIVNDAALAKLLMTDKRGSGARVTLAFLHTMLHPRLAKEPQQFKLPFALLHPEDDRWTEPALSKMFYDRLAGEKELHLLQGAGHFPIEDEGLHMLVEHTAAFIEKHCADEKSL